jgi:hypothetical protein
MSTAPTSFGRRHTRKTDSSRRALVIGLAVSTLGAGTLALTVPSLAAATPAGCAAVLTVITPGTWETTSDADPHVPVGMLAAVGDTLRSKYGDTVELFYTPYAASAFDQGKTYGDSKATAIDAINDEVSTVAATCPQTEFIFAGYSQGADATGDIASAIGNGKGPISADKVLAVGLLADPGRGTEGESIVGPPAAGTGIADPRPQEWARSQGESRRSAIRKTFTARSIKAAAVFLERSEPFWVSHPALHPTPPSSAAAHVWQRH